MKCQILFAEKNKENVIKTSDGFAYSVLSVNPCHAE